MITVIWVPFKRGYDRLQYKREVAATCQRISENLDDKYPHRLAYFNSWSQFPLPLGRYGVLRVLSDLVRRGRSNILIVPICYTTDCIDTEFVLKSLLSEKVLKSVIHNIIIYLQQCNNYINELYTCCRLVLSMCAL